MNAAVVGSRPEKQQLAPFSRDVGRPREGRGDACCQGVVTANGRPREGGDSQWEAEGGERRETVANS